MGFIAVIGAGAIGGALAQKLAVRDRVAEVRLIDPHGRVAAGKALDIAQSGPIDAFTTRLTSAETWTAAAGADVIVFADAAETGQEQGGEAGLALVKQIAAIEPSAPLLFAGSSQRELMTRAVREVHVARSRVLGSAPSALESALRALTGLMLDLGGTDVRLRLVGVPPTHAVVAWDSATASALPLAEQLPPHVIAALTSRMPSLWPPGPYALASSAARVVEAIVCAGRVRHTCFVALDAGADRCAVTAMPVELDRRGVRRVVEPALTRQERTLLENALSV